MGVMMKIWEMGVLVGWQGLNLTDRWQGVDTRELEYEIRERVTDGGAHVAIPSSYYTEDGAWAAGHPLLCNRAAR